MTILKEACVCSVFSSRFADDLTEDRVTTNRVIYIADVDKKVGCASNYRNRKALYDKEAIEKGLPKPPTHVVVDFDIISP